ncbi:MAG: twitching motility protein [Deltaproteobacteria bacterium RBG_13_43_22]|nr:MAG: twitching motility protein [Deltaproteobacteria bacterium RBG_13_43_22]
MRLAELDFILSKIVEHFPQISDINMTVGRPFQVEVHGNLVPVHLNLSTKVLTPFQTEAIALNLLRSDPRKIETLLKEGSCDLSHSIQDKVRFRVSVFSQKNNYSIIMRKLPIEIPTIEQLGLPSVFKKMARDKNGIILFTGATGTGKTTSLAAILDAINESEPVHVITLEDPVELVHSHKKATFNQRELGADFDSFAHGLRAALRQAPKVILVGEIRDRETMEIALTAAETGHLVLSTLHTVDATQTLNRVLGFFDQEEERQIRIRLSGALRWIISQRLLPRVDQGRVAVFEIMVNNIRVQDLILHGESEDKTFYEIIETSQPFGCQTFDQDIISKFQQGLISEETSMLFASRRAIVQRGLDQIKSRRGEKTTDIEGLALDNEYQKQF